MKKKIVIDADYLIFEVTEGKYVKGEEHFSNEKEDMKRFKKRFKELVKEVENEIAVELLGRYKIKGKPLLVFSDPETNFRYDLYPNYKANRDSGSRSKLFYKLRDWAIKKNMYVKNCEADDVVAYYVRKGYIGASFDKDLLRGVAGIWFDVYHSRRNIVETSELDARNFTLIQTLIGDPTDNIPSLPKVKGTGMIPIPNLEKGKRQPFKFTEKIAIEKLTEHGWDWQGVVKIFKEQGFSEKEAILNRRLIGMDQFDGKKIKLFKGKK